MEPGKVSIGKTLVADLAKPRRRWRRACAAAKSAMALVKDLDAQTGARSIAKAAARSKSSCASSALPNESRTCWRRAQEKGNARFGRSLDYSNCRERPQWRS